MPRVRDLGFIEWTDPYGDLDDMKSQEFKDAVAEENAIFQAALKQTQITRFKYPKSATYYTVPWTHEIAVNEYNRISPTITVGTMTQAVRDFTTTKDHLITISDQSAGSEKLSLNIYDKNLKIIATVADVGDSVASASATATATAATLYFCKATNIYWYNEVIAMDIKAQKQISLYKELDKRYVLSLTQKGHHIFVKRAHSQYQDIGIIRGSKVDWFSKGATGTKNPLTEFAIAYDDHFINNKKKIQYPTAFRLVDGRAEKDGSFLFILTKDCHNALWSYSSGKWTNLKQDVCEIKFAANGLIIGYPNKPDEVWHLDPLKKEKTMPGPTYDITYGQVCVPWFMVSPKGKAKGVVICGYGAYGYPMRKQQLHIWLPWLANGYAVASLCVHGGGENGDDWWAQSRTAPKRHVGVSDFVEGVIKLQTMLNMDHTNTVIYGRSAGGFLVTAAFSQLKDKIAAVYAAKPYTDVLRTTTNTLEPQTFHESEEFGAAYESPVDFYETLKISPYENIPVPSIHKEQKQEQEQEQDQPLIILTAGTNDTEVLPYMPIKYAKALRDKKWKNVVCRIAQEGHFTEKAEGEAADLAIIDKFIQARLQKATESTSPNSQPERAHQKTRQTA